LIAKLAEWGFNQNQVLLLGNKPNVFGYAKIDLDIRDRKGVAKLIAETKPAALIHLAGISAPSHADEDPDAAWDVNFLGAVNLADSILRYNQATRLIFAGSASSYGDSLNRLSGDPIQETASLRPQHTYAATKAAADVYLRDRARDGLQVICFRAFNHTGPGQSQGFVTSDFARQIALIERGLQEPILRTGNLETQRDFLDVRDVARAYIMAIKNPLNLNSPLVLNLCSGQPRSIKAILEILLCQATTRITVIQDERMVRNRDVFHSVAAFDEATKVINWRPQIPLEVTLRDTLEDWRCRVKIMQANSQIT
jgi:GDP-4-dehydro-6-deoxy-D-mannose reductase